MRSTTVNKHGKQTHNWHHISFVFSLKNQFKPHHPFPAQQNHFLHPLPLPALPLLRNGTSSSSSKKHAGYPSPLPIISAPIKLPKLVLQPPNTAAAVAGLASAVSSLHRLSSGFCWLAMVEPGDVEIDERCVVAVELEERMRKGMRRVCVLLPLLLLMLRLGRRVEGGLLKVRLGLRGW